MQVNVARLPLYAAGFAVVVATAVTGCTASSSSSAGAAGAAGSSATAPANALDAVKLAAKTASSANSFTGTLSLQVRVKPGAASSSGSAGAVSMTATFAERLHPSLLARVDMNIASLGAAGTSMPGGIEEIVTPSTLYMKWSYLTQLLHLSKPWLAMSVPSISQSSGIDLSQIFSQESGSDPLTQSQLLQGATSVHQVGTGSIDGVPVTEYTGTVPLRKAMSYLSGLAKTQMQQVIANAGFTDETYTVWIDGQHTVRKAIITEVGKTVTESVTTTTTSINQPVNITVPAASETSPLPGGDLSGLS
jgi:hypothetical protein